MYAGLGFFMSKKRVRRICFEADANKDGFITCDEFCDLIEVILYCIV